MSNVVFKTPPILAGSTQQQIASVRDYLFYMQKSLTDALNNLDAGNFSAGAAQELITSSGAEVSKEMSSQVQTLKELIIKNADIVRTEMDELKTELSETYVAQSEYGEYKEETTSSITANARAIEQEISARSELNVNIDNVDSSLQTYISETQGRIRLGVVYENDVPVIGVAVGQDVKTTGTVVVDGKTYDVIDTNSYMSVFTAQELAFYMNDVKVAYMSNTELVITKARITDSFKIGDWLLQDTANGLVLKYDG